MSDFDWEKRLEENKEKYFKNELSKYLSIFNNLINLTKDMIVLWKRSNKQHTIFKLNMDNFIYVIQKDIINDYYDIELKRTMWN